MRPRSWAWLTWYQKTQTWYSIDQLTSLSTLQTSNYNVLIDVRVEPTSSTASFEKCNAMLTWWRYMLWDRQCLLGQRATIQLIWEVFDNDVMPLVWHLHQRRFRRIYLSTNPSPHDPQNLLLAQTNRPMKTPRRIFSIIPSCQSDLM